MLSFSRKKGAQAVFEIDSPAISIAPYGQDVEALLKNAGVDYQIVSKGYIVFTGKVFNSEIPLMIGIHFAPLRIQYIEIFRTKEYDQSEQFNIHASYAELSGILREKYGNPLVRTSASIGGHPCEQWITPGYIVNHYIMDRFGPEEHLHINFYKQ